MKVRIKIKKTHGVLEFNQSQCLKPYVNFNTQERIEAEKNGDIDGKVLRKFMNNAVHGKTIENLKNRIDVRLLSNEKDYLKWTSQPNYMSQKIYDNDLATICKSEVTLTLKACVRYFLLNFYFSPNDSPSKTMKNVFYFILKDLFILKIFNFLHFHLPLFFPLSVMVVGSSPIAVIALEVDRR